jgi:tetratricopeptide (TPR) repeat protein
MRDYAEEEAMLHELASSLAVFDSLVTFNGKSFDVPLLESRYVLARLRFPLSEVPHFDLLHPARNLWKARLESCRLTELEYVLLGHEREDDVPGELIPSLYFDYVRTKDASRIHKVFSHNCHDILSLAALTIRASEMLDEGAETESPLDDYSLGRIFERAELSERSVQHYLRVIESGIGGTARRRSLRQLASHYKRRGEVEEALGLWKDLTVEDGPEAIQACEELAMVHEHRHKDFSKALEICDQALERIEHDYYLPLRFRERSLEAFQHRRRRLERKLNKKSQYRNKNKK